MMKAAQLRQAILQAAVQGKLVSQNPHDEPASALLERIRAGKAKLVKVGKLKKDKSLPPITEDEIPYNLPDGWEWCRLGEISNYGHNDIYDTNKIPSDVWLLELEDIEKETGRILKTILKKDRPTKSTKYAFSEGQVLLGKLRPYLNKVLVAPTNGFCSSEILPLSFGEINPSYSAILLRSPFFVDYATRKSYGVKMPRLGTTDGVMALYPLPPLAEQQRIVNKLDGLMAMCDELEAAEKASDVLDEHFIEYLSKSILQAAVQGKLVPQNPNEEPASALLERIRAEKSKLIKAGKLKKDKPLLPITEDEIPYDLPDSWEWCRLGELIQIISGVSFDKKVVSQILNANNIRLFRGGNIVNDAIKTHTDDYFIPTEIVNDNQRIRKNDIVIVSSTGSKTVIGKAAKANIVSIDCTVGAFLRIIRPVNVNVEYADYLFNIFCSNYWRDYISKEAGGTNINNIKESHLSQFLIPLPPLAEQQRIVAKVEELMVLCAKLKTVAENVEIPEAKRATIIPLGRPQESEPLRMAARGKVNQEVSEAHRKAREDMFSDD